MGRARSVEMALHKAEELFKTGDFLKAAGQWTRAIKADPDLANDALLQSNLCYALLKAHKFAKALEAADAALELTKGFSKSDKTAAQLVGKANYRRGLCMIALERWDEAVTSMQTAQVLLGKQNQEVRSMLQNSMWRCRVWHEENGTECPKSCVDAEDPNQAKENKENAKPKKTEKHI